MIRQIVSRPCVSDMIYGCSDKLAEFMIVLESETSLREKLMAFERILKPR